MPLTLDAAATEFLERPRRGAEAAAEEREVRKFVAALGAARDVAAMRPGQVEDYERRFVPGAHDETDLARALRTNAPAQAHLRAVQTFLRWLHRQGHTATNLATAIKLPGRAQAGTPDKNL